MRASTVISILRKPAELFLILRIVFFLLSLPLMIRAFRIKDLVRRITPSEGRPVKGSLSLERVIYLCERLLRIFQQVGLKYSCLRRSLLLYHFLRSYGVPVSINFGAKWAGSSLTGHSWLTLDENIYLDTVEKVGEFVPFFSLPHDRRDAAGGRAGAQESPDLGEVSFD